MLADTMTAMAAAFINDVTHGAINKMILERINETWKELNPAIEQILTAKAEQILRERFAAMFGDKS
jgi:hypothetical protein